MATCLGGASGRGQRAFIAAHSVASRRDFWHLAGLHFRLQPGPFYGYKLVIKRASGKLGTQSSSAAAVSLATVSVLC